VAPALALARPVQRLEPDRHLLDGDSGDDARRDRRRTPGDEPVGETGAQGSEHGHDPEEPELGQRPRAGFTDVFVTGMLTRWISVRPRPIAIGANPCGARSSVAPRMIMRNMNVMTSSVMKPLIAE
jgi:hypothetical protein